VVSIRFPLADVIIMPCYQGIGNTDLLIDMLGAI
jgi:hypothetical protein